MNANGGPGASSIQPALAHSMSPQTQYSRGPDGVPVPIYPSHSVPMGAAPLRPQNNNNNTRPAEQNVGDHPHYQYNRTHPPPLQIPNSSAHTQQPFTPTTHHHMPSGQPRPPLLPISPYDRTSAASIPQGARRQSDPSSLPSPAQAERPQQTPQPAFDPLIISASDSALAPVRSALDTVWTLAVNNMRMAMSKMNNDFTYLANQERQRKAHMASKINSLEGHLQSASQEIRLLRQERHELQNIMQAYKDEILKLHSEKDQWEIERRVLTGMEGRRGESEVPQFDMSKVLGAVTEQVSKEMEQKISAIMDQFAEQKSLRNQSEQNFASLQHLTHVQQRESSERSPIPSASPYIPAQQGSHSPTSTFVVSPISSNNVSPTNASGPPADRVSTPISRSTTPTTVLKDSTLVSTPKEMQADESPGVQHTPQSPPRNLLRRTSSFDQQPRKKPRLMDEREASSTLNPQQPELAMPIDEPKDGDVVAATVKPEPPEDSETDIRVEGSNDATPVTRTTPSTWVPARKPTPNPMPHRTFKTATISSVPLANPRNTKLGIGHIDLLYKTDNGMMTCRMCLSRSRDLLLSPDRSSKVTPVKKFEQDKASWEELVSHCRSDHPKTCRDLEKLGPTQIAEMKQRLMSGEKTTVSRS